MNIKKLSFSRFAIIFALVPFSCTVDENYRIEDISDIDTEMSLFSEESLSFPLGSTEKVKIKDLLAKANPEELSKWLKTNEKGEYSLNASGSYDLSKELSDLDLKSIASFDGIGIEESFSYVIGNIDKSQFNITGKTMESDLSSFAKIDYDLSSLGVEIPTIQKNITFNPKDFMPGDMQIPLTDVNQSAFIGQIGEIKDLLGILPDPNMEIPIQEYLERLHWNNKELTLAQDVSSSVNLGEKAGNIKGISNIALKQGAKITVSLSVKNCILTDGTVTPNFILDMSGLLKFTEASNGKINLSSLVLDKNNGYSISKDYAISGLADGVPTLDGGILKSGARVSIDGALITTGAKSTFAKIENAGNADMLVEAKITVSGLEIDSMDIEVQNVEYDVNTDPVKIALDPQKLPDELTSVDLIEFDPSKKISLDLSATGNTGDLSIVTEMAVQFPGGISLKDNGTGKVTAGGDLSSAPVHSDIVLESLTPLCSEGNVSYSGNVSVSGKARINGKFNTKNVGDGFSVKAQVAGTLGVDDIKATINAGKFAMNIDKSEDYSFELDGMADFGTFVVTLEGSPECSVNINLPTLNEISILADNLSLSIPSFINVDESGITGLKPGSSFDPTTNTFKFNGEIPSSLTIPIKSFEVTPKADGSKTVVKGAISVKGGVKVSGSTITKKTLDELKASTNVKVQTVIPTMTADKFAMKGDFKKDFTEEYKNIVIVDENTMKNLPKEIKTIEKISLKQGTKATFNIDLSGLPSLTSGSFSLRNTTITLPEFMKVSDKGAQPSNVISMGNLTLGNAPIVYSVDLVSLEDIDLQGISKIMGDVKFASELYAEKPSIDLSTLSSEIAGKVKVIVGDGTTADNPGKITIEKVSAKVDYNLEFQQSVPLNDLPEELRTADFRLNVNPVLTLNLKTNLSIPITGSIVLRSVKNGKDIASVEVRNIELPHSDSPQNTVQKTFILGKGKDIDADLGSVFSEIPDSIVVAINANISPETSVMLEPAATYTLEADYDINVPLAFGEQTAINYATDFEVGHEISEYLGYAKVGVEATALSTLPLGVNLEVTFVDTYGRTVPMLDKGNKPLDGNAIVLEIKKSADGNIDNPQATPISLFINPDLTKWDNVAKPIDKVHLKFCLDASDGVSIKEEDFLKIEDLRVLISEITVDPLNLNK